MIDALKDYLAFKRFGVVSYVCLIIHFLCGLILIPVTSALRASETGKFSCAVDKESSAVYRTYVEKTCYSRYEQTFNSPLPFYGFVLLSFGLQVFVSVIYSLAVSSRVDEIADRIANGREEPRTNDEETSSGCYVFYFYFFHLVARSVFGIVFTVLQHTVFYPSGFDFEFSCSLPTTEVTSQIAKNSSAAQLNGTSIICENSTGSEKELWGVIVSVINTVFALIILGEVIYLWRRFPMLNCRSDAPNCGVEFVTVHLLRKRFKLSNYTPVAVELTSMDTPVAVELTSMDTPVAVELTSMECIEFYKQQVLRQSLLPDVKYVSKANLDDIYIDVVIRTGRAQHKFSKEMDRHEIYDVYRKFPRDSICLEKIEDLFYPNNDTEDKSPRTILAVGRPGIGKTVLTKEIIRHWANSGIFHDFYHGKIVFFFKLRCLNLEGIRDMSLKTFLRCGAGGLDEEKFKIVFEHILRQPKKAIFIFDGLDEFRGDFGKCFDQTSMLSNDHMTPMSPMSLFIKLVFGNMLHGATILVTSRPTADEFYLKLRFDRIVEIIGFTSKKIEDYVTRFCDNKNISDLKPKIWNHIKFSSHLLNLCYIPVNCYIVCVTLFGYLTSSSNSTGALPTTLTALYQTALNYFAKHHDRKVDDPCSKRVLKELQEMAFRGMESRQLVFNENMFDEQMRKSGLVNSSINPTCPLEAQFCFIHFTIQEFLAAKYVIETLAPDEIEKFISAHIESGRWHLVLQFIAGLLGEKIKMSGSDYQHCFLAFAKSLTLRDGVINLDDYGHVVVMKCLREVGDEEIVKNVCGNTDLSNAQSLHSFSGDSISSSDWVAATYVCKHLNKLIHLHLQLLELPREDIYFREVCELLQQKCFESLNLTIPGHIDMERLTGAMRNSKCALNHEHAKLRHLEIDGCLDDTDVSYLRLFILRGHASNLQVLGVRRFRPIDGFLMTALCKHVNNVKCCGQLTCLSFGYNAIGDEGVRILCKTLKEGHCKINKLVLTRCSLTTKCVSWLSEVLCDERCKLTDLSLDRNAIGDEGVRMLCADALRTEQCKLTNLTLSECILTDQCVPLLCETLRDRNCRLINLSVWFNNFTEQGKSLLRDVEEVESCKARGLKISIHPVKQGSRKQYLSG